MTVKIGTRLGPYEILSAIGAGGMGEVYRARDTKLNRDVALKVLPDSFANDPDRLARFQREAQVLASLNHPNIAHIHGLEESGGVRALVMELVEGEDLAQRLMRGAIPIDEALPIAKQIAGALEAAHEQGIIHRDLKPANIKVRDDGTVKVLDFGLAKALEPAGAMSATVSMSPTITTPAMTQAGTILGTAAYMAPEQARGKPADKRVDIWSFGCVLFEMLAGTRAFDGDDVATVLASVIKGEPDWAALKADVSMPIVTLVRNCLQKERRNRIADIGVATFVLNHAAQLVEPVEPRIAAPPPSVPQPFQWRHAAWMAVAVSISALLTGAAVWFLTRPASPRVVRTTVTMSGSAALRLSNDLALTPDGSRIVYRGNNQLLVRALSELEPTVLSGVGAPQGVFTSPDGRWVGFADGATIKKVAITGGAPEIVCPIAGGPRGATWGTDGTIIFATGATAVGLQRVSDAGGEPTVLTRPDRERDEGDHLWPEFLPDSKAVLFTITPANGSIENSRIAVLDLRTGASKVLIRGGSHARYTPTGHLVYSVAGTLRAVAFDLGRREVVGTPATVLEGVLTTPQGTADVAVAGNGLLVYVQGAAGLKQDVVSVDRQGRASPLPGLPPDAYRDVRVSPNGEQLALATQDDVWIYDFARATTSRLTTDPGHDIRPLWTPDGKRVVYASSRAGYPELFWRPADGTGTDDRLFARAKDLVGLNASGWSGDGKHLLFVEQPPNLQAAIGQVAIERPSDAKILVKNGFANDSPALSPDGHWLAYVSNVNGPREIFVEQYPELGQRQQISTGGGRLPLWSQSGELFFSSGDSRQMLVVSVHSGPTLVAERPQVLFEFAMLPPSSGQMSYDLAPDGRFLMIRSGVAEAGGAGSNLIVVQNWFEELKRLVPTK